ncbi:MAG: NADH-quinone oxidoreductase subunit NuoE [Planctomycetota bacterium]|jgi:NADH-quinone oxidoreductase subunit E
MQTSEHSTKTEVIDTSKVEKVLEKYKDARGALIPILQAVQVGYGYLPEPIIDFIAERLKISTNEIIGVATFYAQFHLKPRGQHIIKVCCGTACHVKNARSLSVKVHEKLKINVNETSKDRLFTFEEVSCLGACGIAPVVVIDEDVHGELSPDKLGGILDKYKKPEV